MDPILKLIIALCIAAILLYIFNDPDLEDFDDASDH